MVFVREKLYVVNSCLPRRRRPLSSLQNGGDLRVTFLPLPITSSLCLLPKKKNELFH